MIALGSLISHTMAFSSVEEHLVNIQEATGLIPVRLISPVGRVSCEEDWQPHMKGLFFPA